MIQLSPSKLSLLRDCERCFWDANVKKIARPRGIFPSLPGGMDRILKNHFDKFRGSLPPEVEGDINGVLFSDLEVLNKWRNWKSGLVYYDPVLDVKIIGALDDCAIDKGLYVPLDYKTKGSKPKTDGSEYYQTQLDCYGLMLEDNGYKTCGKAYLIYVYPEEAEGVGIGKISVRFGTAIFKLECNPARAKKIIEKAVMILKGRRPESNPDCEYCKLVSLRGGE